MSSNDTLGYPFLRHQIEIIIIPWIAKINTEPLTLNKTESNLILSYIVGPGMFRTENPDLDEKSRPGPKIRAQTENPNQAEK